MKCTSCGYESKTKEETCGLCGELLEQRAAAPDSVGTAVVEKEVRTGPPAHVVNKYRAAEEEQLRLAKMRRKDNLRGYAFAGAATFAILSILFGLPSSLHPLNLIVILISSTIVGAPIGYLIGRAGGGMLKGAVISSGAFAVLQLINTLPLLSKGVDVGALLFSAVFYGILVGVIPGVILGWHVDMNK